MCFVTGKNLYMYKKTLPKCLRNNLCTTEVKYIFQILTALKNNIINKIQNIELK